MRWLGDILERVLDRGIVIAGDIRISLLDIELIEWCSTCACRLAGARCGCLCQVGEPSCLMGAGEILVRKGPHEGRFLPRSRTAVSRTTRVDGSWAVRSGAGLGVGLQVGQLDGVQRGADAGAGRLHV
ncbi:gas vesicle protein [Micromonospora sp. RP3T]|uniref:gas vesicle protein n=1 Tax=Micromonospora sp. RP3T TaxID=2135446 RepID=UPI0027D2C925|nr:gas vesicle protein [Micromonospora sp. RP3T]